MIQMLDLKMEYEYMKKDIDAAIRECLKHQSWILGPEVKKLEDAVAKYLGVKHCIGVSSGTDALVLALRAFALKNKKLEYFERDDEIITTSFTFTATGDAILRSGATPVFVDIDRFTFNIDAGKVREYLSKKGSKVVGILPVHLFGQACNMTEIMKIAREHKLFVLEDVAQAFGGKWHENKLGAIGIAGAFSFFPSKNLGGFGDGGMISTKDEQIAEFSRMLLKHGGKDKYNVDHIGYNARLDTLQAAVLLAKLKYVEEFNMRRRLIAKRYTTVFKAMKGIAPPLALPDAYHVYNQYTIRVSEGKRDNVQQKLKKAGIATAIYYPVALHDMKLFKECSKNAGSLAISEKMVNEVLSLPIEPLMTQETVKKIISAIRDNNA